MTSKRFLALPFICLITLTISKAHTQTLYQEKYRPQFHFSPDSARVGDACGFVHYKNLYHMFWWGKLFSNDLVHYTKQTEGFALTDSLNNFGYWTGSSVIDKNNLAGFGKNKMITVYTMHKSGNESQGLSYSTDTAAYNAFKYYPGNPVLDRCRSDFRDPTVFWYAPTSKWVMVVALPLNRKVEFYTSSDLKSWTFADDFGPLGAQQGVWECPDLIELFVDGSSTSKKWVLVVSVGPNHEQYFIGSFDGTTFTLDTAADAYLKQGTNLDGSVYMGFDASNYGTWAATGASFVSGPINPGFPHIGNGAISTYRISDGDIGTLTSPTFQIQNKAINFLIGGGNHPGQTCINLIINDQIVQSTTGDNTDFMKWHGWDVSSYIGQNAQIQIVDSYTGSDWGHVDVDQIMFSEVLHNEGMEHALWVDFGSDFYASRSFKDYDENLANTSWLAWLGNWDYADYVPDRGALPGNKGFWSIARDMDLKTYPEGLRLVQTPVANLQSLRQTPASFTGRVLSAGSTTLSEFSPIKNTYEIDASFTTTNANKFGFNLCVGAGRKLVVGYDTRTSMLYIDRTNCADSNISYNSSNPNARPFNRIIYAPVVPENNKIRLRIFVDKSSVEVFTNTGKVVLSVVTYPDETQTGLEVFSQNSSATTMDFSAWMLNSIWSPATSVSLKQHH